MDWPTDMDHVRRETTRPLIPEVEVNTLKRSEIFQTVTRPHLYSMWIAWGGMGTSVFLYVFVSVVLSLGSEGATVEDSIRFSLMGVAASMTAVSVLIPRYLLSDDRLRNLKHHEPDLSTFSRRAGTQLQDPARVEALTQLSREERNLLAIHPLAMTVMLIGLGSGEGVALCGLVLSILSHQPTDMLPFVLVALSLIVYHRPDLETLYDRMSRLH